MPIKSIISFGIVSIPISLHTATTDIDIKFNQLHKALANDEAEFNDLWDSMVEKAYGLGAQTSIDEDIKLYNEALEFGSKYMN